MYQKLDLGPKYSIKFKQEKVEEIFKVFEFLSQDKFFSSVKYKLLDDLRKVIETILKLK